MVGTLLEKRMSSQQEAIMNRLILLRVVGGAAVAALLAASTMPAGAEVVVRIGMTAADIPRTLGQPDQGFEGNRFTGNTMYEGLTTWDLSSADRPAW
jgi:peptide/nickel transport system substrate-binding protein